MGRMGRIGRMSLVLAVLAGAAEGSWVFDANSTTDLTDGDYVTMTGLPAVLNGVWTITWWGKCEMAGDKDGPGYNVTIANQSADMQTWFNWGTYRVTPSVSVVRHNSLSDAYEDVVRVNNTSTPLQSSADASDRTALLTGWHHYAVVRGGTTYAFYIDGVLAQSRTGTWPAIALQATTMYFGARSGATPSRYLHGAMAEWGWWRTTALSVEQIRGLAGVGACDPCAPSHASLPAVTYYIPMHHDYSGTAGLTITNHGTKLNAWDHPVPGGAAVAPYTPILLYPTDAATGIARDVTLAWRDPYRADVTEGYEATFDVFCGTNEALVEANDVSARQATGLSDRFAQMALTLGQTYYWRVESTNSEGSAASGVQSFTVWDGLPNGTKYVTIDGTGDGSDEAHPMAWADVDTLDAGTNVAIVDMNDAAITNLWTDWPAGYPYWAKTVTVYSGAACPQSWTFSKYERVGRYQSDKQPWVLGPVAIVEFDPASVTEVGGRVKHGSVVNPPAGQIGYTPQGWDNSAVQGLYDMRLNIALDANAGRPAAVDVNSSIVSMYSYPDAGHWDDVGITMRTQFQSSAILTVVPEVPAEDAFRPGYCDPDKRTRHEVSDVNTALLPELAPPYACPYSVATLQGYMQRPWVNNGGGSYMSSWSPMPYGFSEDYYWTRELHLIEASLITDLSVENKTPMLLRYLQYGIDMYAVADNGGSRNWTHDGGFTHGRKLPILLAGILFNYDAYKNINLRQRVAATNGDFNFGSCAAAGTRTEMVADYIAFGEDEQTGFVNSATYTACAGAAWAPDTRAPYEVRYLATDYADDGMPEWIIRGTDAEQGGNADWSAYYRFVASGYMDTPAMVIRAFAGGYDLWGHPAYFAWMDRCMIGSGSFYPTWRGSKDAWLAAMYDTHCPTFASYWDGKAALSSPADGATGQATTVTLTWTAPGYLVNRRVYLSETSPPQDLVYTGTGSSFEVTGLTSGHRYYWQVQTEIPHTKSSGLEETYLSAIRSLDVGAAVVPPVAPGDPQIDGVDAIGATNVAAAPTLTWVDKGGTGEEADSFDLYFSDNESLVTAKNGGVKVLAAQDVTTYLPGRLLYNHTYYWRAVANKAGSTAADGEVWSFTTKTAPKGFSGLGGF